MKPIVLTLVLSAFWAARADGQCPWSRDPQVVELQSSCVCNSSGKEGFNALSVQCQAVNFPMLMSALRTYTSDIILENLYISNTTIGNTKTLSQCLKMTKKCLIFSSNGIIGLKNGFNWPSMT